MHIGGPSGSLVSDIVPQRYVTQVNTLLHIHKTSVYTSKEIKLLDLIASFKFAVSLAYMKSSIFLNQNLKLFVAPSQYNWYVELPMSKFPSLVINNFVGVYTGNFY